MEPGADFDGWPLDAEARAYLRYHERRYAELLRVVDGLSGGQPVRVLDVGPNFQTELLRRRAGFVVDTLGYAHPLFPPRPGERHVELDLNQAAHATAAPTPHDVVVLAEVIEHLYTSPAVVLGFLAGWLRTGGALVVQTPNAVALHKRIRMLAGRSPWEAVRDSRVNPGHLHEYTLPELAGAGHAAGLELVRADTENYFGSGRAARLYGLAGRALPPSLRHGITAVFEKQSRGRLSPL